MASNSTTDSLPAPDAPGIPSSRVYPLAGAALLIGLALGYFLLGPKAQPPAPPARVAAAPAGAMGMLPGGHPMPTMEQMKAMADVKAAPLLEALKTKPKDPQLLAQLAALYTSTHQFKDAAAYYKKAVDVDPKNVSVRTQYASSLYYSGDADGALKELQQALKYKPDDVNALFNLGMIKFKGKNDAAGAVAAWQQLLKAHPDLDRRSDVEQLIAEAQQKPAAKN
jgi:cytochrome c-type biogenesis protein CcmH/NrfG